MSVNPTAQSIAREYGYGYHEVRVALNRLETVMPSNEAERTVRAWASDHLEALDEAAADLQETGE